VCVKRLLTAWSRLLLEKLTVTQLIKKPPLLWNPVFYYRVHKNPPIPRPCVTFHNKLSFFLRRRVVSRLSKPKLRDHTLSVVRHLSPSRSRRVHSTPSTLWALTEMRNTNKFWCWNKGEVHMGDLGEDGWQY